MLTDSQIRDHSKRIKDRFYWRILAESTCAPWRIPDTIEERNVYYRKLDEENDKEWEEERKEQERLVKFYGLDKEPKMIPNPEHWGTHKNPMLVVSTIDVPPFIEITT